MPQNFSFLLPGQLAGMACPGRDRPLEDDLAALAAQGVGAVVSLTERPLEPAALARHDLAGLHLPVRDFAPPTLEQIGSFVDFVDHQLAAERPVAVHCGMGRGRTGTMLACYLVRQGWAPAEAIAEVRRRRPGSLETATQERMVHEYARRRAQEERAG